MLYYRVKNMETFKDGNVFGDRVLKIDQILIISEVEKERAEQSGAVFEVLETLIKNPLKEEVSEEKETPKPKKAKKNEG